MKCHYNVKCSSYILTKYYISTYMPGTFMHMSHPGRSLEVWCGVEIGLPRSRPLMNSSFSSLVVTESVTRQVFREWCLVSDLCQNGANASMCFGD